MYRTLLIQIAVTIVLSLVFLGGMSLQAAFSILLGGITTILPAWIFMKYAFSHKGARAAKQILLDFYIGIFLKFVSIGLLFYVFFTFFKINGPFFMLSFILTQIVAIIAPRLFSRRVV
jgi:ATP synthase protein I